MANCTVVIINYNTWGCLEKCLSALSKQTSHDFDVLIVDNNSAHPCPESILKIIPQTSLIKNTNNQGFAVANNQAFAQAASSEWFVLINPDAYPDPDCIAQLINAAKANPGFSLFGSRLYIEGTSNRLDGDGDRYHISGLAWRDRTSGKSLCNSEPYEVFSACAAAVMIRSDIIKQHGGFDEDFFCYMEDVDFGFRMRLFGKRCLLVPDSFAYHVGSASSGGRHSDFAVYHGHRNLVWTYIKNMPGALLWIFLPLHCAINLLTVIWFSLRGQGRVILRAKVDALRGLPQMWRKRKRIQCQRVASVADVLRVMDKSLIPRNRFFPDDWRLWPR
jgi:GT2 family glycosyltransferase